MPERTSATEHEYAGRQLQVGDVFTIEQKDVSLLLLLGRIEPIEGESGYHAKPMEFGTLHLNRKNRKAA